MNIRARTLLVQAMAVAGLLAAGQTWAQTYGYYPDHQFDYASQLSGDISNNSWVNLTASTGPAGTPIAGVPGLSGTGGFPGLTMWGPQASQINSSYGTVSGTELGGATLNKVANGSGGGPYAAGGSIYFGGFSDVVNLNGGTLSVVDSTPLAGLETVVFQVGIGEAWTYDFLNHALPTLTVTTASGTSAPLVADFNQKVEAFDNGTVEMPTGTETVYINQYALQWNLSGYSDITSLAVSFSGVQHAQLYGLTLTEGDTFTQVVAVPEASMPLMMAAGLGGVAFLVRRRRPSGQQAAMPA
ncbi:MAG TPA: hypothetical protein PKA20_05250 [Burkholderiaceae bacterium]|nr:hypothetical protein [Burkholderiaceae bacterium]